MQPLDLIETHAYGMKKDLAKEKKRLNAKI